MIVIRLSSLILGRESKDIKCNNDECGRTFSGDSNNPFRCSKKVKDNWKEYFNLITKGLSLRECAKKMNITIVTSFF